MANLWGRIMAGASAFRSAFMSANMSAPDSFVSYDARTLRYNLLWSLFENTAYTTSRPSGVYRHIRNIYNPANRLGIFYQTHLWGGALDAAAGDGKSTPSALPIITDQPDALRAAIAQVWLDSGWQARKDIVTLWGAVLGDVGIKIIDDPTRGKVHADIVYPASIKSLLLDPQGNVKGYEIKEQRADPRADLKHEKQSVTYREVASREPDSDDIIYQTFLDDKPYAWTGDEAEWREPYSFVPLVMIKNNDVGLDFGWAEIQSAIPKAREIDSAASALNDRILVAQNSPWFLAGVDSPGKTIKPTGEAPSTSTTQEPGREELNLVYGPAGATATPLVTPLDIAAASANIRMMLDNLEDDLPEISDEIFNAGSDQSGVALDIRRDPVEDKIQMRRQGYDNALVRAHQMAISIGGMKGYKGYEGFNLDSFNAGKLNHSIGYRPGFRPSLRRQIDEQAAMWTAARIAGQSGVSIDFFLRGVGWSEDKIADVVASPYYKAWVESQTGGLG